MRFGVNFEIILNRNGYFHAEIHITLLLMQCCDLCNSYDLIFLQEIWLFQHELPLLSNICSDFEGFGTTAMDISNGIMSGRPYGGVAVIVRKSIQKECQVHTFDDSRLLGITVNTSDMPCYFLNVYMPYQCDDNYDLFVEYIGKISSIIEESVNSNLIVLGDFNVAVDTVFESELLKNVQITSVSCIGLCSIWTRFRAVYICERCTLYYFLARPCVV